MIIHFSAMKDDKRIDGVVFLPQGKAHAFNCTLMLHAR
jgi:hypothetical protein